MAKVNGPLMGLEASGTVAGTITFSKWKGRAYVRKTVVPSNPNSIPQQAARAVARFVSQYWGTLTDPEKAAWDEEGKSKNITGLNAWLKDSANRRPYDKAIELAPNSTPATAPGAPTSPSATGGKGFVTLAWTNDTATDLFTTAIHEGPTGFTPTAQNAVWILPATEETITLTGLAPGNYFFKIRHGNESGIYGTATSELTATVT
jgi:hypothetical protein